MDEAEKKLLRLHWPALGRELRDRTLKPVFHPSFVIFFVVAILGVGPTGFWIELFSYVTTKSLDASALRASFVSFVPAFVAATTMQLIWAENAKRSLRAFAILILSVCMLGLIFCKSSAFADPVAITFGVCSTAIALWMWWIANANQKEFHDESEDLSRNPIGGESTDAPLAGDLSGFQTE